MKKTINIHLSGILFNIEEDAYDVLSHYIKSLERHFEGKKEILEDIENRIAELLNEKLNSSKQVITLKDIQEIIDIMGTVEELGVDASEEKNETHPIKKRFYRNPDDKVIGGVCGGIAAYFDIDPLWIRLAWAILFFVYGTGFLFYLLLWVIIPEAKTPSQKLEMKGEKINISNISKGISEDVNQFTKRTSKEFSKFSGNKFVDFIQSVFQSVLDFCYGIGKSILKFFSVFSIILLGIILILLIAVLFNDTYVSISSKNFITNASVSNFFTTPFKSILFSLSIFLLIGIPITVLIIKLFVFVFNIKKKVKYLSFVALILWIIGWGLLAYSITDTVSKFSEKAYQSTQTTTYIPSNKTLFIKMQNDEEYSDDKEFEIRVVNKLLISESTHHTSIGFPSVVIKKSEDDSTRIKIISSAVAENKREAKIFSKNIHYEFNLHDTIIELSSKYDIPKEDQFHFQKIKVIIEIPTGRYVYLSKSMENYLSEADNNIDADEEDMCGKKWLMGIEHLQCIENCDKIENTYQHKHPHKKEVNSKEDEEN
ncbi:MAG: PspC domain-containing protein [Bacteroidia bacterium]|nr:PspC domain-containing protein [Bacteroidia bacterium]